MTASACKYAKLCLTQGTCEHVQNNVASGLTSVAGISASTCEFMKCMNINTHTEYYIIQQENIVDIFS